MNMTPVALLCVGAGSAALGWLPRYTTTIGTLPAVGGFLLKVIADSAGAPAWVSRISPFQHLALVPYQPPAWTATAVMLAVAVALWLVGASGYRTRDLHG
jgi:ABC-2 type transport system permease protein